MEKLGFGEQRGGMEVQGPERTMKLKEGLCSSETSELKVKQIQTGRKCLMEEGLGTESNKRKLKAL